MQIQPGKEKDYEDFVKLNSGDPYSARVVSYANDWADKIEAAIANGETLEAVAEKTAHEADTDGITGFMYGAAVATLANFWVHGDALRAWHNDKTGATVNPALLNTSKFNP